MRVLLAFVGVSVAAIALAIVMLATGGGYTVTTRFENAGQIARGSPVETGGQIIGSVKDVELTDDGQVDVVFEVDQLYAPLPRGTRAGIRQLSLVGLGNRYIDLSIPPETDQGEIPDGGRVPVDAVKTQVDVDQLFATFDSRTRRALKAVLQGSARAVRGRGRELNRGLLYLNPAVSTSSRLFRELTRDVPVLERTLVDGARLVTALAERRDELAALIGDARDVTRALGSEKLALAESIARLPPVMRRANTTFVNLRAALRDVDPLVEAATPAVQRLRPFLAEARGFAHDSPPTLRDLRLAIRRPARQNDLVDLTRAFPALGDIATVERRRRYAPGRRSDDVGNVPGAFPQVVEALESANPVIALARPYTSDFLGFVDDYSTTGASYDALGGFTRGFISVAENGRGGPPKRFQFRRCPGGAEAVLPDRSNKLTEAEQDALGCEDEHRAVR